MTTNADDDNKVSFSATADVEGGDAVPVADAPSAPAPGVLRATNLRRSLTASAKQWDIDGDGELDDAELALKGMDKGGKGTLSKEQMYQLMNQNLAVQKELSGVKKVVYGLAGFTVVLALANVGTSFAAAYLAKDTKMENGKLTGMDGKTVQTDTSINTFELVEEGKAKEIDNYRRELCVLTHTHGQVLTNYGVPNAEECTFDGTSMYLSKDNGEAFIQACASGGSATIGKRWTYSDGSTCFSEHYYCGWGNHIGTPNMESVLNIDNQMVLQLASVTNQDKVGWNMGVIYHRSNDLYQIAELKSMNNQCCETNDDCATRAGVCTVDKRCTGVEWQLPTPPPAPSTVCC